MTQNMNRFCRISVVFILWCCTLRVHHAGNYRRYLGMVRVRATPVIESMKFNFFLPKSHFVKECQNRCVPPAAF